MLYMKKYLCVYIKIWYVINRYLTFQKLESCAGYLLSVVCQHNEARVMWKEGTSIEKKLPKDFL